MKNKKVEVNASQNINLRKVLFIDPPFQKSFLLYTVGSALGVSLVYFLAVAFFFSRFRTQGVALGLAPDHVFFRFLSEQEFYMGIVFFSTTVLMTLGLLYYGLYLSNRIAGPIHHAKEFLQKTRKGEVSRTLQFREKDYFNGLAEEINQTLAVVSNQNKKEKGTIV
jgi:hypothetical protein